jgi:hypothetical protein
VKLGGLEQTKKGYREQRGLPLIETTFQNVLFGLACCEQTPA